MLEKLKEHKIGVVATIISIIIGLGTIITSLDSYAEETSRDIATQQIKELAPKISQVEAEKVISPVLDKQLKTLKSMQSQILSVDKRFVEQRIRDLNAKKDKIGLNAEEETEIEFLKEEKKDIDSNLRELNQIELDY